MPSEQSATVPARSSVPPPIVAGSTPELKAATMSRVPESGRKFPCKQCGARLDFDPSERALKCPYCGFEERIAPAESKVQERDFQQAL